MEDSWPAFVVKSNFDDLESRGAHLFQLGSVGIFDICVEGMGFFYRNGAGSSNITRNISLVIYPVDSQKLAGHSGSAAAGRLYRLRLSAASP